MQIKPIPKPEGSIQPQLFYVPTDSNDGPPPALLKKQAKVLFNEFIKMKSIVKIIL